MRKGIILAADNQKGGSGKSTSVQEIAGSLDADFKQKVLTIEGDPQGNLSDSFLGSWWTRYEQYTLSSLLKRHFRGDPIDYSRYIFSTYGYHKNQKDKIEDAGDAIEMNIKVIAARKNFEVSVRRDIDCIKNLLEPIRYEYDYILLDCRPAQPKTKSPYDITAALLAAADYVITPATVDLGSLEGYYHMLKNINDIRKQGYNSKITSLGLFFSRVDFRSDRQKEFIEQTKSELKHAYIDAPIRSDDIVCQAFSEGVPLAYWSPQSAVTKDYKKLTEYILRKTGGL